MPQQDALHLTRWTVTSGSNAQSRGAVVIEAGDHHWKASSQGNGAVDALVKAVDKALAEVLAGHPRLVGYVVRSLGEGPDAEGLVTVTILPPAGAKGARGEGEYSGASSSTNIIAASIEAYVEALNKMLDEAHWAGAAEAAAAGRTGSKPASPGRRAEYDKSKSRHDTTSWFDQ
ncbi:MAG TPA: alpha-isopropylmalate synthase regulatory domain-containing protein [Candidatus Limnocylindrales bacterium]|nr:alpha-isopropylmalate synthase regulatory domain-containing protein [Candidatus Limnocylindrales bacterium]